MKQLLFSAITLAFALGASAGDLKNPSFEQPLGPAELSAVWGEHGEIFGDAGVVKVGAGVYPKSAKNGVYAAQINAPAGTWNGIWQQLPWKENSPVKFEASYLIQGGNLPPGVTTFMKLEFFDEAGTTMSTVEGKPHVNDTGGKWIEEELSADTPPGTKSVRFVMIAGENNNGDVVINRIYWDLADAE